MKKLFTQKINFTYSVIVVLVLVLGVSQATAQYAAPGQTDELNPLIHRGGGEQSIEELRLGDCSGNASCQSIDVALDARGVLAGALSWFDDSVDASQSFVFATLQNSFLLGNLFIGENASPALPILANAYGPSGGTFNIPIQKVNVHGNALATNLENTPGNVPVCVENDGTIVLCPVAD